jgi:hypothetical protein
VPTPTGDVHALAFFSTDGHILNSTRTVDGIYFFDIDIGETPEDAADLARYLTAPIYRTLEDAGAVMFADSAVVERVCDDINRAWLSAHDLPIVELLRLVRAVEVAECASRYIPEWVKCHDRLAVSLGAVSRILAQHPEETTGEAVAPGEAAEIDPSGLETLADGDFWRYDFPIVEPMTH